MWPTLSIPFETNKDQGTSSNTQTGWENKENGGEREKDITEHVVTHPVAKSTVNTPGALTMSPLAAVNFRTSALMSNVTVADSPGARCTLWNPA